MHDIGHPDAGGPANGGDPPGPPRPSGGHPAIARARLLLVDADGERRGRLRAALAALRPAELLVCDSPADLLRLLEERTDGPGCELEVLLVDETLLGTEQGSLAARIAAHPAWRELPLLGLAAPHRLAESLQRQATRDTCLDLVWEAQPEALALRLLGALQIGCERRSARRLRDLTEDALISLDRRGRIASVNRSGCMLLGRDARDLAGRDWFEECLPPQERAQRRREFQAMLDGAPAPVAGAEERVLTADGAERLIAWRQCPHTDARGRIAGVLLAGQDVSERNQMRSLLHWHASHDLLTGLVNRSTLEACLAATLEAARDAPGDHVLCHLDVDQFKLINDTCGYEAGDELLRQIGGLLPAHVTGQNLVARLGGDQFAVLLHDCDRQGARQVAARLHAALDSFRFLWQGRAYRVGVSIGMVVLDADSGSSASVLGAADAACHAAKRRGGGRTHFYEPDDAEVVARQGEMQWVLRIKRALDEDRFQLWLQPIQRIGAGGRDHYELLLRMLDEDGNVVLPGAFLPIAERFHLSTRIDRWVIRQAFSWLASERGRADRGALCCINLSGLSLGDEAFLEFVVRELSRHGLGGERICFEVTETAAIGNLSGALRFIRALKSRGVRFALDDFGSGLSSFAYLKSLPVDFLKIDGVFIKDIAVNPIDHAMVRSIHEVARVMGKETIGEFAESTPVLESLREIGVHFAQGFAVGRPRPLDTGARER